MKDRVPVNPGRVLISPEDGSPAYYATMTRADNPTQDGDPLNKNTFLKDTTAAMYGLNADAVPDDMFRKLSPVVPGNQGAENAGRYWSVDDNGGLVFRNPTAKFSNGPFVITSTQTVDFTQYGLKVGSQLNVVCIGGGAGATEGGAAGKGGTGRGGGGGGGGGGYGGGGGGNGERRGGDGYRGGGSGYISSATVTLSSTSVAVTIGAGGAQGGNGGTTSFGGYLSAAGGNTSGSGGHAGGLGGEGYYSTQYEEGGGGGGGGGGWLVEGPTVYSGSAGEAGTQGTTQGSGTGGAGGTGGGAGGTEGVNGGDGGPGHGAVIFWY